MNRRILLRLACVALAVLTIATVMTGLAYHFLDGGERLRPAILPMCLLVLAASVLVDRYRRGPGGPNR